MPTRLRGLPRKRRDDMLADFIRDLSFYILLITGLMELYDIYTMYKSKIVSLFLQSKHRLADYTDLPFRARTQRRALARTDVALHILYIGSHLYLNDALTPWLYATPYPRAGQACWLDRDLTLTLCYNFESYFPRICSCSAWSDI